MIWQIGHITADISQIKENLSRGSDRIHQYFRDELKLGRAEERKIIPSPATPRRNRPYGDDDHGRADDDGCLPGVDLVYTMITLLCLRHRFREFVLRLVPDERRSQTKMILLRSVHVVQRIPFRTGDRDLLSMGYVWDRVFHYRDPSCDLFCAAMRVTGNRPVRGQPHRQYADQP